MFQKQTAKTSRISPLKKGGLAVTKLLKKLVLNRNVLLQTLSYDSQDPQKIVKPAVKKHFSNNCQQYHNWTFAEYHQREFLAFSIQIRLLFLFLLTTSYGYPKFQKKSLIELIVNQMNWKYIGIPALLSGSVTPKLIYEHLLEPILFSYLTKPSMSHHLGNIHLPILNNLSFLQFTKAEGHFLIAFSLSSHVKLVSFPADSESDAILDIHPLLDLCRILNDELKKENHSELTNQLFGKYFETFIDQKKYGSYYTPKFVTDFITERVILLKISQMLEIDKEFTSIRDLFTNTLIKEENWKILLNPQKGLPGLRILDLGVGSGEFLLSSLYVLVEIYEKTHKKLGHEFHYSTIIPLILSQNLYGVDTSKEAVQICKLRLWLVLTDFISYDKLLFPKLYRSILTGNSLVGFGSLEEISHLELNFDNNGTFHKNKKLLDEAYIQYKGSWKVDIFHWLIEFQSIMESGGFDVLLINPPYIRTRSFTNEEITHHKQRYSLFKGYADIYFLFYERALQLLKHRGIAGILSSNQFLHRSHGKNLVNRMIKRSRLELILDFYRSQIFPNATTYIAILTFIKGETSNIVPYCQIQTSKTIDSNILDNIQRNLAEHTCHSPIKRKSTIFSINYIDLSKKSFHSYRLEKNKTNISDTFDNILGDVANIKSGLTTGLDRIYIGKIIGSKNGYAKFLPKGEKNKLNYTFIEKESLRPVIFGRNIRKWESLRYHDVVIFPYRFSKLEQKFILINKDTLQSDYPLTWNYFNGHKDIIGTRKRSKTEKYSTRSTWYEIPRTRLPFIYAENGLVAAALTKEPKFALNSQGAFYVGGTAGVIGIIPKKEDFINLNIFLLALLSSKSYSDYFQNVGAPKRNNYYQLSVNQLSQTPIPDISQISLNTFTSIVQLSQKILSQTDSVSLSKLKIKLNLKIKSILTM